jgi:hypothetical protein
LGKALAKGKLDERLTQSAAAFNHRRDWLFADRPPSLAPLRTRFDHHYQQSKSRRLGRGLRRYGDCQRDSGSPAASFRSRSISKAKASDSRKAQGRPTQAQTRNPINRMRIRGSIRSGERGPPLALPRPRQSLTKFQTIYLRPRNHSDADAGLKSLPNVVIWIVVLSLYYAGLK